MGKIGCLALLLFVCGCETDFQRISFGAGFTTPIERTVQKEGAYISYSELSYKHGVTLDVFDNPAIDLMAGPRLGIPLTDSEDGVILGLEAEARIRQRREGIQPYIGFHVGKAYFTERWPDQGTNWGFTLGPMVGFKCENWTLEWRIWHESNGTKVFGHDQGPNPGFNASMIAIGVEF